MSDLQADFIRAVSHETGVPECFLTGDTAAEVWDAAQRLVDWKVGTAPPPPMSPPTAAVSASLPPPTRVTPQQLVEGDDWLRAWRTGKLAPVGMPAPPQRAPRGRRGMPW